MKDKQLDFLLVQRFIIPILLLVLLGVYYLALRPTIGVYQSYHTGCSLTETGAALSVSPGYTAQRITQVNGLYNRYRVDTLSWKNTLWNSASGLSGKYGCKIIAYPAWRKILYQERQVFVQRIGYSGNYSELIKLLREAEVLKNAGVVTAIRLGRKPREANTTLQIEFTGIHQKD